MKLLHFIGVRDVALLAFALPPLIAAANPPSLPGPFESFGGTPWTVADFDGDGRPDVLIARPVMGGPHFRHQIDIQLSSTGGRVFSFAIDGGLSGFPGVQVVPRDVDGDHDLDLVFTTAVSHQAIGVWINDGAGAFTRGDAAAYGGALRTLCATTTVTHRDAASTLLFIPRQPSPSTGLVCARYGAPPPPAFRRRFGTESAGRQRLTAGVLRARAPPAFL